MCLCLQRFEPCLIQILQASLVIFWFVAIYGKTKFIRDLTGIVYKITNTFVNGGIKKHTSTSVQLRDFSLNDKTTNVICEIYTMVDNTESSFIWSYLY